MPTPAVNVTVVAEAGYSGAVPLGELAGPAPGERLCARIARAVLPYSSMAVSVTLKATPASCSLGVGTVNFFAAAALTVKLPEVPSIAVPSFAFSVVLWAS